MKKIISIILLSVLLITSITGCSLSNKDLPDYASKIESSSIPESSSIAESSPTVESSSAPEEKPVIEKDIQQKIKDGKLKNSDVVGYIQIPNTPAEDLVLKHPTDVFFYERKDISKKYNLYGCFFADPFNTFGTRDKLSPNTTIYAHNMRDKPDTTDKNDQKFSQILRWKDLDWAKENPYIYFSTEEETMVWEVFAAFYTTTFYKSTQYDYNADHPTEVELQKIIDEAKLRSDLKFDVNVTNKDKIITLSTCTYKYGGAKNLEQRFVVQAKLVDKDEKLKEKAIVSVNSNPKQPEFSKKY